MEFMIQNKIPNTQATIELEENENYYAGSMDSAIGSRVDHFYLEPT